MVWQPELMNIDLEMGFLHFKKDYWVSLMLNPHPHENFSNEGISVFVTIWYWDPILRSSESSNYFRDWVY